MQHKGTAFQLFLPCFGLVLTLFLVSLRLNIKLLYLFLYLLSVSLYKWKSSLSVFLATSEALSTEMFKSDSFNLKCKKNV